MFSLLTKSCNVTLAHELKATLTFRPFLKPFHFTEVIQIKEKPEKTKLRSVLTLHCRTYKTAPSRAPMKCLPDFPWTHTENVFKKSKLSGNSRNVPHNVTVK